MKVLLCDHRNQQSIGHQRLRRRNRDGGRSEDAVGGAATGGSSDRVMDRRAFISGALGLLAAPLAARAQPAGKVYRIGILGNVPLTDPEGAKLWGAFVRGLHDLGYVEGQNLTIEHQSSEGRYERVPALAGALVRL